MKELRAFDNGALSLDETLFHNANGYIGVRGAFEEGYPQGYASVRGTYVNGVYDIVPMPQAEPLHGLVTEKQTLVNIADIQDVKLYVDGILCTPLDDGFVEGCRILDMDDGVTVRTLVWKSPQGKVVRVEVKRMASFVRLPLFLMTYRVVVDAPCEIQFVASHRADVCNFSDPSDPRVASESLKHIVVDRVESGPETIRRAGNRKTGYRSLISTHAATSEIAVVSAVQDEVSVGGPDGQESAGDDAIDVMEELFPEAVVRTFTVQGRADRPVALTRYAAVSDGLRYDDPSQETAKVIECAVEVGVDGLYAEQTEYLRAFWSDVDFEIDGDEALSEALTFNIFQLLQSVGKDGRSHLAAKGLSGEGYEGHYFWDTEMYVQPLFTLTKPEFSRQLLAYRYSILPQARENARALGHRKGALFPWRTISGKECSGFFPAGTAQYHIDGAIAYAVVMYYLVTGDDDFMEKMGLELLLEIARLWYDLGNFYDGKFELHCVTGPDEYTCVVNNNYYTNVSAKYDLVWAVKYFRLFESKGLAGKAREATRISDGELDGFLAASDAMYLPYDAKLGITPQDDSFLSKKVWDLAATPVEDFPLLMHYHPLTLYRYQVCKQADTVLAHFLYEDEVSRDVMERSFRYYEKLTTHDSSLSTCIFSIMASRLGFETEAYDYFGDSVEIDIHDTHGNTKDGIHTANMGGSCLAILFGFAGLRIKDEGVFLSPSVPHAWKGYRFTLKFHGRRVRIEVGGGLVSVRLLAVEGHVSWPVNIFIYGNPMDMSTNEQSFPLRRVSTEDVSQESSSSRSREIS
ncbi:MAG: glycoside hydrolase family 65 protein [Sphaerochaetaceae bacterium]|jgi:alpha,alpha-trehalose phosphorylase